MRGDLFPLAMILSIALTIAEPPDREAAAAIRAHAERNLRRVAGHDLELVRNGTPAAPRTSEPASFRAPAPWTVRAGEHRHADPSGATRMFGDLIQYRPARR